MEQYFSILFKKDFSKPVQSYTEVIIPDKFERFEMFENLINNSQYIIDCTNSESYEFFMLIDDSDIQYMLNKYKNYDCSLYVRIENINLYRQSYSIKFIIGCYAGYDVSATETLKTEEEIKRLNIQVDNIKDKLNNSGFLSKAPEKIIEKEKSKLSDMLNKIEHLQKNFKQF